MQLGQTLTVAERTRADGRDMRPVNAGNSGVQKCTFRNFGNAFRQNNRAGDTGHIHERPGTQRLERIKGMLTQLQREGLHIIEGFLTNARQCGEIQSFQRSQRRTVHKCHNPDRSNLGQISDRSQRQASREHIVADCSNIIHAYNRRQRPLSAEGAFADFQWQTAQISGFQRETGVIYPVKRIRLNADNLVFLIALGYGFRNNQIGHAVCAAGNNGIARGNIIPDAVLHKRGDCIRRNRCLLGRFFFSRLLLCRNLSRRRFLRRCGRCRYGRCRLGRRCRCTRRCRLARCRRFARRRRFGVLAGALCRSGAAHVRCAFCTAALRFWSGCGRIAALGITGVGAAVFHFSRKCGKSTRTERQIKRQQDGHQPRKLFAHTTQSFIMKSGNISSSPVVCIRDRRGVLSVWYSLPYRGYEKRIHFGRKPSILYWQNVEIIDM